MAANGRVMVLIQLAGGNDGLNTIIPLDQYSALSVARSNILIPEKKVLPIDGISVTGFHPSMQGIQKLYNDGLVNIVQGVCYPDPIYSHFRASDIWLTASDATQYLNDGWLGRYLAEEYNGYPQGYPNNEQPDPPAIEIGTTVSKALVGPNTSMGMALTDIDSFYHLIGNTVADAPDTPAGHELTFLRYIAQQTQSYTSSLQKAAAKAKNISTLYPAGNALAEKLKIVARLIAGGLQTPIYLVSHGSFDSHANQTEASDTTAGTHAALLNKLSEAVVAFLDDCKLLQTDDRVAAMTFSEFGRRIISNGSQGTDHGSAQPIMVFGKNVNPGIIGSNPVIPVKATVRDNLDMQHDYRSVYASVLADWFQVSQNVMQDVLLNDYSVLPIFKKATPEPTPQRTSDMLSQNYPNPFALSTTISFKSEGGNVFILLLDHSGRSTITITNQEYAAGNYTISVQRDNLPAGNYFYKFLHKQYTITKKMTITNS